MVQAPSKEKASEFIKNITEKYAAKEVLQIYIDRSKKIR